MNSSHPTLFNGSVYTCGDAGNPPLLLLHGFAGTHRYWERFTRDLQKQYFLIIPDLPGHGKTIIPKGVEANWQDISRDLLHKVETLTNDPISLVGYSMGARFGMYMLTQFPERFTKAMFVSGSVGISDLTEREERFKQDVKLANLIRENGMAWFADYWEQQPIFRTRKKLPEAEQKKIRDDWLDQKSEQLAAGLIMLSVGNQECLIEQLKRVTCPMLFVAGADDEKYSTLAQEYQALSPTATSKILLDCGHDVPREKPKEFLSLLCGFLNRK